MRIAVVVVGGLHPSGRVEVMPAWIDLLGALARRVEVHAFVLRHLPTRQSYELRGFTVHDLGRPSAPAGLTRLVQWRRLVQALHAHGPFDVIHGIWGDPPGLLAALAARRFRVPSVVTCDSGELVSIPEIGYGQQRTWRGRALIRAATRYATTVTVATRHMQRLARAHAVEARVIPFGVVAAPVVGRPAEGPPWRLLQTASLNRVKDQATLLHALRSIGPRADVHVELAGGDALDGEIQALAARLGVAERVTFHDALPADALPVLRARAHLYVQSSRAEASGAAVLEAAAAGLPLVGTRVGHLADLAPDGATAVPPGDASALAEAIVTLLADPDRRTATATVARAFARTHDAESSADALANLYGGLRLRKD